MKTVLVTGATGALGRAVTAALQTEKQYQLVTCTKEELADAITRNAPDVVLHLAASFSADFQESYAMNVETTRGLLETVEQSGKPIRVLLCGSAAEYGVVQPHENPLREDRTLHPVSIYGLTKAWQTQLAGYYAARGVQVVVARIFNLDGPGISERLFVGRVQKQIEEVLAKKRSVIEVGPLSAIRDYVSTETAAKQILAIAMKGEPGRVYHVASGKPITMRELLSRYLAAHGLDAIEVREAEHLSNRNGYDVPEIYADISKTALLLKECT